MITSTRIASTACPSCGVVHDCATHLNKVTPSPGHFSVCFNCAQLNQYGPDLQLIEPSLSEMIECQIERPDIWQQINLLQRIVRQRIRKKLGP